MKMNMGYLFMQFNFEEFNKGKLYAVKKAEEKYEWDSVKKEQTNVYEGVKLTLEIKQDDYVYPTKDGDTKGINQGEELTVLVKGKDVDVRDYQNLVTTGFEMPIPVEIIDVEEVSYFTPKNKKPVLRVTADVRETSLPTNSTSEVADE